MTLRSTLSTPEGKRRYVRRLFATIADRLRLHHHGFSHTDRTGAGRPTDRGSPICRSGDRVLDLACGTGDLVFAAARRARHGVGLDITHRMLELAASKRPRNVALVTGDMLALPFDDARFDVVTTGYGLRNVPDLRQAIPEIAPRARAWRAFLSLDFNRPTNSTVRALYLAYLTASGASLGSSCMATRIPTATFPSRSVYIPEPPV